MSTRRGHPNHKLERQAGTVIGLLIGLLISNILLAVLFAAFWVRLENMTPDYSADSEAIKQLEVEFEAAMEDALAPTRLQSPSR